MASVFVGFGSSPETARSTLIPALPYIAPSQPAGLPRPHAGVGEHGHHEASWPLRWARIRSTAAGLIGRGRLVRLAEGFFTALTGFLGNLS
jgi:hypothetical protein